MFSPFHHPRIDDARLALCSRPPVSAKWANELHYPRHGCDCFVNPRMSSVLGLNLDDRRLIQKMLSKGARLVTLI